MTKTSVTEDHRDVRVGAVFICLLFSLLSCETEETVSGSRKGRRKNRIPRGDRPATEVKNPAEEEAGALFKKLPVTTSVDSPSPVEMVVSAVENNTKVTIATDPANQPLNILAGFSGEVASTPQQIVLTRGEWEMTFYMEQEVSLESLPSSSVKKGQKLAVTRGPLAFTLKKNGELSRFCVNVIDQTKGLIRIRSQVPGEQCPQS